LGSVRCQQGYNKRPAGRPCFTAVPLRSTLTFSPFKLLSFFSFFLLGLWVRWVWGVGLVRFFVGWVCGGVVPRFVVLFLFLLWFLFLLFLLPLFAFFLLRVLSVFVVLVRLFLLLRFGLWLWLPFLRALPFLVVVLVVCVVWLVLLFLRLRSFGLLPSASGGVRSLLVRLLWCVRSLLRPLVCGCPFRVCPAPLGSFLPPVLVRAFVVWVRVRGLRLRSLAVRVFLRWFGCPLGVPFLLRGVLFRWGAVGFSAPSFINF
jgi:hypothetical protein